MGPAGTRRPLLLVTKLGLRGGHGDGCVFVFEEFVDAHPAAFAAKAGLLDASERGGGVGDDSGVDPTMPTSSAAEKRAALSRSWVKTYPTRPHSVSLARWMTSSSVSKTVMGATGPKISVRLISASAGTSTRTVGL
ncbi:hypothetical protein AHiyo8_pI68020 (plasmid) [Arthrobacter sp. Hiyo8]|nr:hypothetical protein AHiyo8_pI68020 [Arthrobacter sp. Hiyo8]